ncbi:MAG: 50S ribosome-binding GTPase, partial [Candidatus Hydrogenedentes bacterium]|nr:50S ribosome-binding GTPase [Candidatus Hydrogenedentota bacterium]
SDETSTNDLSQPSQQLVVARGGRGGLGNTHFASSTNQAPRIAQAGEVGEEKSIMLEMRLIADVGIIGYPNVGKSTLLTAASAAKPKIASYPFTTLEPILGVVEVGLRTLVLAEIPGLVDGAHLGRGLGHDFLRHIERTRGLIMIVDLSSADPVNDYKTVLNELVLHSELLAGKPRIVAANKIDLMESDAKLERLSSACSESVFPISALRRIGLRELAMAAYKLCGSVARE